MLHLIDEGNRYTVRPRRRSVRILRMVTTRQICLAEADGTHYLVRLCVQERTRCGGLQPRQLWSSFPLTWKLSKLLPSLECLSCAPRYFARAISKGISKIFRLLFYVEVRRDISGDLGLDVSSWVETRKAYLFYIVKTKSREETALTVSKLSHAHWSDYI